MTSAALPAYLSAMRRLAVIACVLLLAGSAWAQAAEPAAGPAQAGEVVPPDAQPKPKAKAYKPYRPIGRPAFLGLIAATFLIIGALAGANDKITKA